MFRPLFWSLTALALIGAGCPSPASVDYAPPPMSGSWSFQMTTVDLQGTGCPAEGSVGFNTQGDAELTVTQTGERAVMNLDGQQLVFHRQSGSAPFYQTNTRMFPVRGHGPGTVYFDFMAQTSDSISGTIYWNNNDGCTGDYSFVMYLIEPELPGEPDTSPYTLSEGQWGLEIDDVQNDCWGADVAGFTGLPDTIELTPVADLDTGAPSPSEFYADTLGATFEQLPGTNVYAQTGTPFDLGAPVDEAGDVLLDFENESFEGTLEIQAGANGTATAQLYASGNACGAMLSLSLTLQ